MSRIFVFRESSKVITISAVDHLTSLKNEIVEYTTEMSEVATAFAELDKFPEAVLIMADPELVKQQKNIAFLRKFLVEKDTPVFLAGYKADLELMHVMLTGTRLVAEYPKPFDVLTMCTAIDTFVKSQVLGQKKKILLVDDSGQMLRRVQTILSGKYDVVLANSGAMALKRLSDDHFDLMLLDYEMPIMDGRQVLQLIRSDHEMHNLPVIFLTGKSDKQSIIDVMALKPEGYLLKNLSADGLLKAVDDFFAKRKKLN